MDRCHYHRTSRISWRIRTVTRLYMPSMTGSAAAPTAGLHFTPELLKQIEEKGIDIARVTLHVGLGTFRPVKVDDILEHHMHSEFYHIDDRSG